MLKQHNNLHLELLLNNLQFLLISHYLTAIQDEGYYVVLASGRPTEGMIPTARDLKLPELLLLH
jgi:hypothetical protein